MNGKWETTQKMIVSIVEDIGCAFAATENTDVKSVTGAQNLTFTRL